MALRNTIFADYFYRILERSRIPQAKHSLLSPNQVTVLGLLLAVLVPIGFYVHPVWGLVFMIFSGCADAMDGWVAKRQGTHTIFGAFLDSSFDRISDFFYLFGFWVLCWHREGVILISTLVFLAFLFSFMISYTKARVEGLGINCEKGLMERGLRTVYLILWALALCLFPPLFEAILWFGLIVFCILTLFTVIQRIIHIRSEFDAQKARS
jgi:phosphatidylglycerophosphate synthase